MTNINQILKIAKPYEIFINVIKSKKRLNNPNIKAKNGDYIINIVETKKGKKCYKIVKYGKNKWFWVEIKEIKYEN